MSRSAVPLPSTDRRGRWLVILLLGLSILLQAVAFRAFCAREILPVYPRMYDQNAYLARAFDTYFKAEAHGVPRAVAYAVRQSSPQGLLLTNEAGLAFLWFGPTRMTALWINFLHFALLQIAVVALSLWARQAALGLAITGTLAGLSFPFFLGGGMVDFRLDFAAFCLWGVLIAAVIRSHGLVDRRWSLAAGLAALWLGLTRTIAVAFIGGGSLLFLAGLLLFRPQGARTRAVNLLLAGCVTALGTVPFMLAQLERIMTYYVLGHVTTGEKDVRVAELGISGVMGHLSYYASSVVPQVGKTGLPLVILLCAGVALLFLGRDRRPDADDAGPIGAADRRVLLGFLAAMAAGTYAILTADLAKSPIVGSVFIIFMLMGIWTFAVRLRPGSQRTATVWTIVAALLFVGGQGAFAWRASQRNIHPFGPGALQDYYAIMETIGRMSAARGLTNPAIGFDTLNEYSNVAVVASIVAERVHVFVTPTPTLGAIRPGLGTVTADEARQQLRASDFVVLGPTPATTVDDVYPVNRSLNALAPSLYQQASDELLRVRDGSLFGRPVTLFAKALEPCINEDDGWVSERGLRCRFRGAEVRSRPLLEVTGQAPIKYLGRLPAATIAIGRDARPEDTTACDVRATAPPGADGNQPFVATCVIPAAALAMETDEEQHVRLLVRFDPTFVPKEHGLGPDPRRLSVPWPKVRLIEARP